MRKQNNKILAAVIVATGLSVVMCGCGTAKISRQQSIGAAPAGKPRVVYVADFELDAADIKSEPGMLPALPKLPGPLGDKLPPLPGTSKDPKKLARDLVNEMSESLVKDLTKAGVNARRLSPGTPLPNSGWLVRGVFTDVNQGNQLRRAVIGFGMGKTDLQVVVDVNDLAQGAPRTFYELNTTADSGKAPGAGPTIVLGPAGLAARFVSRQGPGPKRQADGLENRRRSRPAHQPIPCNAASRSITHHFNHYENY